MKGKSPHSYAYIIFQELLYEYDYAQQKKVESKIKRRLKYYQLASYDQERVDYIRNFKNKLSDEIQLMRTSQYYDKTASQFAVLEDFNVKQMVKDYALLYPQLSIKDIRDMISWGIHWLYER